MNGNASPLLYTVSPLREIFIIDESVVSGGYRFIGVLFMPIQALLRPVISWPDFRKSSFLSPDGLNLNFCTDTYYTTRNNERNDFDMINFAKFMEAMEDYTTVIRGYVESYDSLIEGNTIIYPKKSKDPNNAPFVIVRNKKGRRTGW